MPKTKQAKAKSVDLKKLEPQIEEEAFLLTTVEAIQAVMKCGKIKHTDLADRLGVSKPNVTTMLSGNRNMTLKLLSKIAFALDHRIRIHLEPMTVQRVSSEKLESNEDYHQE